MLTSPARLISHPSRAFSLIEAAIVLAITGLVLAAIWLTSTSVLENRNAAKTAEGILYIANQVQRKLTQNDTYGSITNINSTGIEIGLFPLDWVSGSRGVARRHCWSGRRERLPSSYRASSVASA